MRDIYKPGETLSGVVDGMAPYGAFIELPDGRTGLCHVSKLGEGWVDHPSDVLTKGQEVEVRVLRDYGKKVSLAIERTSERQHGAAKVLPLEPMLKKYLEQSGERQSEQRANRSRRLNGRQRV